MQATFADTPSLGRVWREEQFLLILCALGTNHWRQQMQLQAGELALGAAP